MDLFITSDVAHQSNPSPRPSFFEPLKPTKEKKKQNESPPPSTIEFHLIIADPGSDSSLTPGWTVPDETLVVPASITLGMLFSVLREHLPVRRHRFGLSALMGGGGGSGSGSVSSIPIPPASMAVSRENHAAAISSPVVSSSSSSVPSSPATRTTSSVTVEEAMPSLPSSSPSSPPSSRASNNNNNNNQNLLSRLRRPKLDYARIYLTRSPDGAVVPLCEDDADWHVRGGYVRVDLFASKSETEWRMFKELVVAAEGRFKCFMAIKGVSSRNPLALVKRM